MKHIKFSGNRVSGWCFGDTCISPCTALMVLYPTLPFGGKEAENFVLMWPRVSSFGRSLVYADFWSCPFTHFFMWFLLYVKSSPIPVSGSQEEGSVQERKHRLLLPDLLFFMDVSEVQSGKRGRVERKEDKNKVKLTLHEADLQNFWVRMGAASKC